LSGVKEMISDMYIAGSKMVHLEVHNQIQVSTSLDNELPFLISFRIRATFTDLGPDRLPFLEK
jgi:hypothetical protein